MGLPAHSTLVAGGGDAEELALMRRPHRQASDHAVILANDVLDGDGQVRERRDKRADDRLEGLQAVHFPQAAAVPDEIRGEHLVEGGPGCAR